MKKLAPEAIKAAVANAKKPNRYPGTKCQGKGQPIGPIQDRGPTVSFAWQK